MLVIFFLLCIFAIIHFIYERIILPEIRLYYRNELFVLRDKIRDVLLNNESKDDEVLGAKVLHNALNNSINRLHYLTISNRVTTIKILREQPDIRGNIQRQIHLIKKSNNQKIIDVFDKSCLITNKMFIFNSLLTLIYFTPIFFIVSIIKHIFKLSTSMLDAMCDRKKEDVEALSFSSDKQFNKLVTHI